MSLKKRLDKIEAELGVAEEKSYTIIRLGYRPVGDKRLIIWEKQGGKFVRSIDSLSEEGKAILQDSATEKA